MQRATFFLHSMCSYRPISLTIVFLNCTAVDAGDASPEQSRGGNRPQPCPQAHHCPRPPAERQASSRMYGIPCSVHLISVARA